MRDAVCDPWTVKRKGVGWVQGPDPIVTWTFLVPSLAEGPGHWTDRAGVMDKPPRGGPESPLLTNPREVVFYWIVLTLENDFVGKQTRCLRSTGRVPISIVSFRTVCACVLPCRGLNACAYV